MSKVEAEPESAKNCIAPNLIVPVESIIKNNRAQRQQQEMVSVHLGWILKYGLTHAFCSFIILAIPKDVPSKAEACKGSPPEPVSRPTIIYS